MRTTDAGRTLRKRLVATPIFLVVAMLATFTAGCSQRTQPAANPSRPTSATAAPSTPSPSPSSSTSAAGPGVCPRRPAHPALVRQGQGDIAAVAIGSCLAAVVTEVDGRHLLVSFVTAARGGATTRTARVRLGSASAFTAFGNTLAIGGTQGRNAAVVTVAATGNAPTRVRQLPGSRVSSLAASSHRLLVGVAGQPGVAVFDHALRPLRRLPSPIPADAITEGPTGLVLAGVQNGQLYAGPAASPARVSGGSQCGQPWIAASRTETTLACNETVAGAPTAAWLFTRTGNAWRRTLAIPGAEVGPMAAGSGGIVLAVLSREGRKQLLVRSHGHWERRPLAGINPDYGYQPTFAPDGHTLWLGGSGLLYRLYIG